MRTSSTLPTKKLPPPPLVPMTKDVSGVLGFTLAPVLTSTPFAYSSQLLLIEAFPWATAPAYLVRDNDGAYGHAFRSRVRAMGIRDRPISPRSPWQNPYVERLIGTIRRECLDGMLVFGEAHRRQILSSCATY